MARFRLIAMRGHHVGMDSGRTTTTRALDALAWVVAWTLLVVAVVASLTPRDGAGFSFSDKLTHVVGYTALSASFLLAAVWLPRRGPGRFPKSAVAVTVAVAAVGAAIELLQGFVGRTVDARDVVANIVGCVGGRLLWGALRSALSERSA
jgi:VanZ family protein